MSTRPIIFISAVSKELRSARDLVAKTLISLGYDPKWQDIAPTETGLLPKVLRDWIDQSDAVIQLVGHHYGFAPKEADAEFGECSYTQLEALYARQQGKKVWYLILTPEHPTEPCATEASTPRSLQDAYRAKVTGTDYLYHRSSSQLQTENIVLKLRDDLAELRQAEKTRQDLMQQGVDSANQKASEILAGIHSLNQKSQLQPQLLLKSESWPQPAPFHNRAFPDQHNFVGRAALLIAMKQSLDAERNVALTQPVVMHGAGGIGKTRAAVEFARAHGSAYTLCLFLDAQSPEALRASLVEVARKLELTTDPQASADALVLLSLRLLRAVPTALVVADNADTPAALEAVRLLCHEPGGVRWLITTRLTDLGEEFAEQPVGLLTEAAAVELLQKRARKKGHQPGSGVDACAVAIELGRLPLALQQAAAYVAHMRLTWTAYSKLLADNPAQAFSCEAKEMKDLPESILRTYIISFQQLTPLALTMMAVAAHLAPAPIPEVVFLHKDDDGSRRAALVELADLSLFEWQAGLLEIHRAIAIAVRLGLDQGEDRKLLEMSWLIVRACAPTDTQHPKHWPAWAVLRPHIEHLLTGVSPAGAAADAYRWLLGSLPIHLLALGEYAAAEGFHRIAISYCQHTLGAEHPGTLACRGNLAIALNEQGKHAEAEQEHRAVLKVIERLLGREHPDALAIRNNLANTLRIQGKYAEAEQEHWAVGQIQERINGNEHPDTLMSRMNWANALAAQDKHAEAVKENKTVLQIKERVLGAEHPATLMSRMSVANSLAALGRHAEAEHENRAALQIQERVMGTEHPDTLMSRENLANTLAAQGRHAEAEQEHRAVIKIEERVLGPEHPSTLLSRMNLTNTLAAQGRHTEAESERRSVLQIQERVMGEEHPETLKSRMNLASRLQVQGKHAEAEQECRVVLKRQERVLGAEHPSVALSCYNLAICIARQQKLPEALSFIHRAEQLWAKVLGLEHPDTKNAKAKREIIEAALKQDTEASHPGP